MRFRLVRSGAEPSSDVAFQAVDDRRDRGIQLGLGERPIVVTERQPIGEAHLARGERLATVDVEERHVPEDRSTVAADRRRDLGGRPLVGHDDGQVAFRRLVA